MVRRLAAIGAFVLIMLPFAVIAPITIGCWAACWLLTGEDRESILLNGPMLALADWPVRILHGGRQG